eukprot:GEMP01006068.1.p1 GENE.GEMP01006068.1~~GEMP01006068.1.p1  ORF type:complete len:839 (+),score=168.12 GEMP01006068.1:153-2669(+)
MLSLDVSPMSNASPLVTHSEFRPLSRTSIRSSSTKSPRRSSSSQLCAELTSSYHPTANSNTNEKQHLRYKRRKRSVRERRSAITKGTCGTARRPAHFLSRFRSHENLCQTTSPPAPLWAHDGSHQQSYPSKEPNYGECAKQSKPRRRSHRLQTLESFLQLNTHSDYVALSDIEKELSSELEYMRPEDLPTPLQYFLLPASPIQPITHRELTDPIENQMVWMASPDALNFEHPIERLDGCAGGTASFFALRYAAHCMPHYIHSNTFWVGKDLSHAENENEFYSELRTFVLDECADKAWRDLALQWCCACAGVLEAPVFPLKCPLDLDSATDSLSVNKSSSTSSSFRVCSSFSRRKRKDESGGFLDVRQLLLLENLRDGYNNLRMLDVKIGAVTALGGWRGKSRVRALRNQQIDRFTNSALECYRLEGIQSPPEWLETYFEESKRTFMASLSGYKKAARMVLQRMRAGHFLALWLDCRGMFPCNTTCEKYAHVVLLHTIRKLRQMVHTFGQLSAPQVWIGSSIAIGFDSEPPNECMRDDGTLDENAIVKMVTVKAFDWGRSELNSPRKNKLLSHREVKKREKYWKGYLKGACRLLWECARLYVHRAASPGWKWLVFELAVYHSLHDNEVVAAGFVDIERDVPLEMPYTVNLMCDRAVEARLSVSFSALTSLHASVCVQWLTLTRKRTARFLIGCVAFSESDDALAYIETITNGSTAERRMMCRRRIHLQGRAGIQYTGLCEAGPGDDSESSQGLVRHFRDENVEFIADESGDAQRKLVDALDLPSLHLVANAAGAPQSQRSNCSRVLETRFPPFVGDSMQDERCAAIFQDEVLPSVGCNF